MNRQNKPLKYIGYSIVCEEVPDEVSLAFNISGCTHHCDGCHSKYLWKYEGRYLVNDIKDIMIYNNNLITCVCFLGGEQNIQELYELCKSIKENYSLKTCIYTGCETIELFNKFIENKCLNYLKIGKYKKKYGGLNNINTNQKMYKIKYENGNTIMTDITYMFNKKEYI